MRYKCAHHCIKEGGDGLRASTRSTPHTCCPLTNRPTPCAESRQGRMRTLQVRIQELLRPDRVCGARGGGCAAHRAGCAGCGAGRPRTHQRRGSSSSPWRPRLLGTPPRPLRPPCRPRSPPPCLVWRTQPHTHQHDIIRCHHCLCCQGCTPSQTPKCLWVKCTDIPDCSLNQGAHLQPMGFAASNNTAESSWKPQQRLRTPC